MRFGLTNVASGFAAIGWPETMLGVAQRVGHDGDYGEVARPIRSERESGRDTSLILTFVRSSWAGYH